MKNSMKKSGLFAALICVATLLLTPAHAQEMAKQPAAPKPAVGPAEEVLQQWNDIGRKLIAMAEDFPDDKYDFKPAPAMRSFAERLIHAAHANEFLTNALRGQTTPDMDDPKRDQFKTKAEVVGFVKKSFLNGAAAIKAKGDKGISDQVVDPFSNQQTTVGAFACGFIEHSGEVYGQLTVYYRLAGLVPPESRPKK
jgi:uncharacterized damage-inducible protein DinB